MSFVHRRIFYAKVGMADPLVDHFKQIEEMMRGRDVSIKTKIMTDNNSGRSDTVVVEWEMETEGQMHADMQKFMEEPGAAEAFSEWESKLPEFITHSVAENWTVR